MDFRTSMPGGRCFYLGAILFASIAVSACGGGSSGSAAPSTATPAATISYPGGPLTFAAQITPGEAVGYPGIDYALTDPTTVSLNITPFSITAQTLQVDPRTRCVPQGAYPIEVTAVAFPSTGNTVEVGTSNVSIAVAVYSTGLFTAPTSAAVTCNVPVSLDLVSLTPVTNTIEIPVTVNL